MTPDQIKRKFRAEGRSFKDFARENNLSVQTVYKLLNGQTKGNLGKAHEAAVKLGLKTAA